MRKSSTIKFILVLLFISIVISNIAAASCPLGLVNDPSPGSCSLYVDSNKDNICDLSEKTTPLNSETNTASAEELTCTQLRTYTVADASNYYNIDEKLLVQKLSDMLKTKVSSTDTFAMLEEKYGLDLHEAKASAQGLMITNNVGEITSSGTEYYMWQIALVLSLMYIFGIYLVAKEKITLVNHRKFWNYLLLITFLITAFTSIFVLLRLNYNIILTLPINIVFDL